MKIPGFCSSPLPANTNELGNININTKSVAGEDPTTTISNAFIARFPAGAVTTL